MTNSYRKKIFILGCAVLTASLITTTAAPQKYVHQLAETNANESVRERLGETDFGQLISSHGSRAQEQKESPYGVSALYDGSGFVRISAGEFLMGSRKGNGDEQPVHRVHISRSFEIGKFEVTQAQWESVMASNISAHAGPATKKAAHGDAAAAGDPSHFKGPTLPVENVSWDDVQLFLAALNALDKKHIYRLPTEAEWEYACKAGGTEEDAGSLGAAAWFRDNSRNQTRPVGQKEPNAWGLYDMRGNVWEWVQDWYGPVYYRNSPASDPTGAAPASYRVYRGGSWHSSPADCRPSFRGFEFPVNRSYAVGFRLVRTATAE